MMRISIKKIGVRIVMTLWWIIVLAFFLRLPDYLSLFSFKKRLYIATWPLLIDAQFVQQFEKETGIKIELTYFERSEELYSKLKTTEGHGYDIIFPSDYTVNLLIKEGLLKKIDKTKLNFLQRLDTRLLGNYYDPNNDYSIPFFWGVFGIGFNKKIYGNDPDKSWRLLFSPDAQHIVMSDNPRESLIFATQYLFGNPKALKNPASQEQVKQLLIKQKNRVDVYTDERVDTLLSTENNPLAVGLSTDISRAIAKNPAIGFFIPEEGSFYVIDSIAIPKHAVHIEAAYAFINYLYEKDVMNHHVTLYNMYSPLIDTKQPFGYPESSNAFRSSHLLNDVIDEKQLNSIWIDVLAH